ncbi:MAG: U32 family peptidase C-terminal domain-containing protein [Alphaproteobacteria bacterium]|nr:U32 family peptidase C-terminal domain-containing protein [Alphaproteobacteria bacterium]
MKKAELLLPAGSLVKLKTAILYGADAVYAGTPDMSLRTQSKFTLEDLKEGIDFVHSMGKKIYLTLNLYIHNEEAEKLPQFVQTLRELQPDGVLVADPGVFYYLQQHAPELKRFVSTQANICSGQTVKFWQSMGASLCVLGREVTFAEMEQIRAQCPDILLECFIHGAMCMSYSGRCLISNFMADRSANKGKCAHCCRWHYKMHLRLKDGTIKEIEINQDNAKAFEFLLEEEFRPGEYYEIVEDEHGGYLLNSKDMCLLPRLNDILRIGMDSLKVEGRNKTEYYAGTVARAYRQAIDDWYSDSEHWDYRKYMDDLYALQNRGYCLGFHDGKLTNISQNYEYTRTMGEWLFAGSIVEWQGDDAVFEVRNYINSGETIEFLIPNTMENLRLCLHEFEDATSGEITPKVSAGQGKKIRLRPNVWNKPVEEIKKLLPQYVIARKQEGLKGENAQMYERKKAEFNQLIDGCPLEDN